MIIEATVPFEAIMATTRKTITVTDQQDAWIKAQIKTGGFTNDSEYVRDLIRRDQARNAEIEAVRAELIKGEASGKPQPFDAVRFKRDMTAKHAQKAR
jgi:antitoxin ParD1/3/4